MGNIGNNEKVFCSAKLMPRLHFQRILSLGLNSPYNIAGFYAETAF